MSYCAVLLGNGLTNCKQRSGGKEKAGKEKLKGHKPKITYTIGNTECLR